MAAAPPLVPALEGPMYFVLCDYGSAIGRAYVETSPDQADRTTVLDLLMRGEFTGPVQVIEVDLASGRARDASADFADDILASRQLDDLPSDVVMFATLRSAVQHKPESPQ